MNRLKKVLSAGALALVVAACGGDGATTTTTTTTAATTTTTAASGDVAVNVVSFAFQPSQIDLALGNTVTFTVSDGSHTVTSATGAWEPSGAIGEGSSFSITPAAAGEFDFFCEFHAQMTGTLTVTG